MKHPIQPIEKDKDGVPRFKQNAIIRYLIDVGYKHGCGLNDLARMNFSNEDWMQLAQLIGYSLNGYGELSYVDNDSYGVAEVMSKSDENEKDVRIQYLENELAAIRESLRVPMARVFGVHPDDLKSVT